MQRRSIIDLTGVVRVSSRAVFALTVVSLTISLAMTSVQANAMDVLVGSSQRSVFNYNASRILCRLINAQADNLSCDVLAAGEGLHSADQIHTLTNVQNGALDLGVIDSVVQYDAVNRRGQFEFFDIGLENIRSLFSLYGVPFTIIARGDERLNSLADIKGKKVNIGNPGSIQRVIMDDLMRASGWERKDFRLLEELPTTGSQDMLALCFGTVDALVRFNVHPNADTKHMVNLCGASLVEVSGNGVDELASDSPFFSSMSIPAALYSSNDMAVPTFGLLETVIATEDLDESTAYTIVKVVFENLDRLRKSHPAFSALTPEHMHSRGLSAPLHPGALKYYRERGWSQ